MTARNKSTTFIVVSPSLLISNILFLDLYAPCEYSRCFSRVLLRQSSEEWRWNTGEDFEVDITRWNKWGNGNQAEESQLQMEWFADIFRDFLEPTVPKKQGIYLTLTQTGPLQQWCGDKRSGQSLADLLNLPTSPSNAATNRSLQHLPLLHYLIWWPFM